jgi:hypothetical protein
MSQANNGNILACLIFETTVAGIINFLCGFLDPILHNGFVRIFEKIATMLVNSLEGNADHYYVQI